MTVIEKELMLEYDERIKEISIMKTIPSLRKLNSQQSEVYRRYIVTGIYALWEGFVVASFKIFIRELNKLSLNFYDLSLKIITYDLDLKYNLSDARHEYNKKVSLLCKINEYFQNPVVLQTEIKTKSNMNLKVLNNILMIFDMDLLPESKYKDALNKLLYYRNSISHGDFTAIIKQKDVDKFSLVIQDLMCDLILKIIDGYKKRTYLR